MPHDAIFDARVIITVHHEGVYRVGVESDIPCSRVRQQIAFSEFVSIRWLGPFKSRQPAKTPTVRE